MRTLTTFCATWISIVQHFCISIRDTSHPKLTITIVCHTKIIQVTDYWLVENILESLHLTAWYSPVRKSHQWKIIEGLGWTYMSNFISIIINIYTKPICKFSKKYIFISIISCAAFLQMFHVGRLQRCWILPFEKHHEYGSADEQAVNFRNLRLIS